MFRGIYIASNYAPYPGLQNSFLEEFLGDQTKRNFQSLENNLLKFECSGSDRLTFQKYHHQHRNLIITGIPRSGTSLLSVIINGFSNAVCLNEILYDVSSLPVAFSIVRKKLTTGIAVPNKYNKSGHLSTDTQNNAVILKDVVIKNVDENVLIGSKVNIPYLNQLSLLLSFNYKTICLIRDPVYTIGSWCSPKAAGIPEANVSDDDMHPRWHHFKFRTKDRIERMVQIWNHYAQLIWKYRSQLKILTYENLTLKHKTEIEDLSNFLEIKNFSMNLNLKYENIRSKYPQIEEIIKKVNRFCKIKNKFGYIDHRSAAHVFFQDSKPRRKIAFFAGDCDNFHFIKPIIERLRTSEFEIRVVRSKTLSQRELFNHMDWSDVSWFEWANGPIIQASQMPKLCKIICRLHRYEAYTDSVRQIDWRKVDHLILVSAFMLDVFKELQLDDIEKRTEVHIIPNAIDLDLYNFSRREKGFNIAYISRFHPDKNPALMIQIMAELVKIDHNYRCFMVGKIQDVPLYQYIQHMVKKLDLQRNVIYEGIISDVNSWLDDKHYILCTSVIESQGMGIIEGMARGLKPVIHNFFGDPSSIFDRKYVFDTSKQAINMILSDEYYPEQYRSHIELNYNLNIVFEKYRGILYEQQKGINLNPVEIKESQNALSNSTHIRTFSRNDKKVFEDDEISVEQGPNPIFSICIPTYNRAEFLIDAIQSALCTNFDKFEVVIVDDGSTDNTEEIVKGFNSSKIKYIKTQHEGAPSARNKCIEAARGEYILWLDSDDILMPDAISNYAKAITKYTDADVIYGDLVIIDELGNFKKELKYSEYFNQNKALLSKLLIENPIPNGGTLVKKYVYQKHGDYNLDFKRAHDYEFWTRIANHAKFKHVGAFVYKWKWHDSNMSSGSVKLDTSYEIQIKKKILASYELERLFPNLDWSNKSKSLSIAYFNIANIFNGLKGYNEAINYYKLSNNFCESQITYNALGSAYFYLGDWDNARSAFKKALMINPDFKQAKSNLNFLSAYQSKSPQKTKKNEISYKNLKTISPLEQDTKILFVVHNFPPHWYAGVENYTYEIAMGLYEKGFDVSVFYPMIKPNAKGISIQKQYHRNLKIYNLVSNGKRAFAFHVKDQEIDDIFIKLIKQENFDIIHFQHTHQNLPLSLIEAAKNLNLPICLTLHDFWFMCIRTHLYNPNYKKICKGPESTEKCVLCINQKYTDSLKQDEILHLNNLLKYRNQYVKNIFEIADIVTAPSKFLASKYNNFQYGIDKIIVSPLGITDHIHKKITAGRKQIIFGYIGSIHELKNIDYLIREFSNVNGRAKLFIWGNGTAENISQLNSMIQDDNRIEYKGPYLPNQLNQILSEIDLTIIPSMIESFSFTVRESLSAFVPVVASNVGGIPEIVRHMKNGILFDPTSVGELSAILQNISDNPFYMHRMKQQIESPKKISKDVREWIKRYKQIIEQKRFPVKCSIIIPLFNQLSYTKRCLESIFRNFSKYRFEVILVDNNSTDGTKTYLDNIREKVKIIFNSSNLGFAKASNQGARASKGEYLVFLNNDTEVQPGWLDELIDSLKYDEQIAIVGAKLLYPSNKIQHAGVSIANSPHPIFPYHIHNGKPANFEAANITKEYQAVSGACMLVKKNVFNELNGFDEGFINGYEDIDLCFRIKEKGYKVVYCPNSVVYHHESSSEGRFNHTDHNIQRLHQKWQGKIFPDSNDEQIAINQNSTSIIILTLNQIDYTKKCIESIFEHTQQPFELIVVDNGSTDGTVEYLESDLQGRNTAVSIKIISNLENNGFAGGNNQGMAVAGGDYIVLMNNDVVVTPGWLKRLIDCAEREPQIGIVGPCSNYVSGSQLIKDVTYDVATLDGLSEFSKKFADSFSGQTQPILRVVGFCMLIKRAVIDMIGGMDDRYGLGNFEDDDFSLRATIAGFESWIARDCFVHHFGHRTFVGEKIDLQNSLFENWEVFKKKWGLPAELSYGSPYRLADMQNTQFDSSIHFYPLEKGNDIMENPSDNHKTAEDAYRYVQTNFSNKHPNEIIEALENLINLHPKFALAHNDLGVLHYNAGHLEKAYQFYQKAVQLDSNNPVFLKNLADFYCIELGRVEDALQIYVNILKSHPDDTETLMATGQICVALERTADAMAFFNRILEIEPWNDSVRKTIEKLEGSAAAEKVYSETPDEIYQHIKHSLRTLSPDEAIEEFQKLVGSYPDFALGHNDLGVLYYNEGNKESALKHYQLAAQLQPENETFQKNLADFSFVELGKVEEALEIYVDVLAMNPQDIETLLITGHICVSLKKFEDARVFYNRVLELDPHNPDAHDNIQALNKKKMEDTLLASDLAGNDSIPIEKVEPNDPERHCDAIQKPEIAASIIMDLDGVHNRVKECIKSIQTNTCESHELMLVERGAPKGILKWAQQLVNDIPNYQIIECSRQSVWAESINQAIKKARGEITVLIHNDIVVPKGWLRAFKTCINLVPNIGVVGPMSNETSGIQQMIYFDEGERVVFESVAESFYQKNKYRRVFTSKLSDFCLVFHGKLMGQIGYLDDQFVSKEIAVEDFCNRVASAGYQNLIAADTYVYHYNRHTAKESASLATQLCVEDRKKLKVKLNRSGGQSHRNNHSQTVHILRHAKTLNEKGDRNQAIEILLAGIGIRPDEDQLYLSLAEILVAAKRFQDARDTLAEMPSVDDVQKVRKAELLGYAEEGLGNFEAALTQAEGVLSVNSNAATALNLMGILAFRNQDQNSAEQFFERAIASDPGYGEPYTNLGILKLEEKQKEKALKLFEKGFILTPSDFDIATNYHSMISELNDYQRAEKFSREASALYPNNQKIRYLLIDCLVQLGKYDEAMQEIETAIVKFGIADGILNAALKVREKLEEIETENKSDNPFVSLCMIVKDEENDLAKCLASVKPIVDEIVVVDTGSTDKTKDIAQAFGATIYDYDWNNDFAEARNYSISKAKGDWIFIMDADEVVSPLDYHRFRRIVSKRPKTTAAYRFTTRNYNTLANMIGWTPNDGQYPDEEAVSGWLPSSKVRLFFAKDKVWFEGAVHEMVDPVLKRNRIRVKHCDIPIHHYGRLNKENVKRKDEVYFEIGKQKLEDMTDDPNAIRELAVQATNMEKNEEALILWDQLLSTNLDPRAVSEIYINKGTIFNRIGDFRKALEAAKVAIENAPYLKEAQYNYAIAELHAGDPKKTIAVLEDLLSNVPEYPPARFILTAAYCTVGDKDTAHLNLSELKTTPLGPYLVHSCAELAKGLIKAKRHSQALMILNAAIECEIINTEILNLFTECIRLKEDENKAINIDPRLSSSPQTYESEKMRSF